MRTIEKEYEGIKFKLKSLRGKDVREAREKTGFIVHLTDESRNKDTVNLVLYQHLIVAYGIVEPDEYAHNLDKVESLDAAILDALFLDMEKLCKLSMLEKKN